VTIEVSWPKSSSEPYELTIETANDDLVLVEAGDDEYGRFERLVGKLVKVPQDRG
jgi:hypothetical protein